MVSAPRIRTPWSQRWRRFRSQVLPVLLFTATATLTVHLWRSHAGPAHVVGEVEAIRVDTISQVDGRLVALPERQLERFDIVMAGEVIAELDDRPALASLATLQAELLRIDGELAATEARVRQQGADRQHEYMDEARRLAVEARHTHDAVVFTLSGNQMLAGELARAVGAER